MELIEIARTVAREAAQFVAGSRPKGRVAIAGTKSSVTDVFTELDKECESLIKNRILHHRPRDGFMGEENESIIGVTGVNWIVDPIDGTVNFVYGLPDTAVSIAVEVSGEVVAGVVVNISTGEEYHAQKGFGAFLVDADGEQRLVAPEPPVVSQALVGTGFHYTRELRIVQAEAMSKLLPDIRDIRRTGSAALNLCQLATGQLDAFVEQGLQPWDLAAGGLIASEAGIILAGLNVEPNERLVMGAHPDLAPAFFDLVRRAGF